MWLQTLYWGSSFLGSCALIITLVYVIKYAKAAKSQVEKTQELVKEAQAQTKETQKLTRETKTLADGTQALAKIAALEFEPRVKAKPEFKEREIESGIIKRGLLIKKSGRNYYGEAEIILNNLSKGDSVFYLIPHSWFQYYFRLGSRAEGGCKKLSPDYSGPIKESMSVSLLPGDSDISNQLLFDLQGLLEFPKNLDSIKRIEHLEPPAKLETILTTGYIHIQLYVEYINEKTVKSDGLYHHYLGKLKKPLITIGPNTFFIEGEWVFNKRYKSVFDTNSHELRIPWYR